MEGFFERKVEVLREIKENGVRDFTKEKLADLDIVRDKCKKGVGYLNEELSDTLIIL